MIKILKKFLLFFVIAIVVMNTHPMDDFCWDDPAIENLINTTEFESATRAPIPAPEIISLLSQFGFINLLQENLYEKSYPLNKRYILDLPLFTFPWYHSRCKEFSAQFFYNMTDKMTFASECNKISAYLAISGEGFIEKLQFTFQEIQAAVPDFNANMALEMLSLFEHFTVQDRSIGVMFDGEKKIGGARFRWFLPFYLHERNHFISPEVADAITEINDPAYDGPNEEAQMLFAEKYLISDRLGFGDFRLECDFPLIETDTFKVRVGFMLDFPIAFPVAYGLIGSRFCPPCACRRPLLDIQSLFDNPPNIENFITSSAGNYLLAALNNLSSILLNTSLGHDGHPGIGVMFRSKSSLTKFVSRPWAENIHFLGRYSIEYLIPKKEYRAFVPKINSSAFAQRDFASGDPVIAEENLLFLEEELTNRLFPPFMHAMVFPGVVIRSTSRAVYEGEEWGCFVGSDLWIRTQESIPAIDASDIVFNRLEINSAERPLAYQSKLFGGIVYRKCFVEDREWAFSLNADTTVLRSGVGKDFTLQLNIDVNF